MVYRHYKTVYTTNLGASVIQAQLRACVRALMQKSHASQTATRLPSSTHNHHLHNGLPPHRPLVTPVTTNIPGRPQTTTTACQRNTTTTRPRHQRQRQRVCPPLCLLPRHATPTTNKPGRPTYDDRSIDNCMQRRQRAEDDAQHPMNDIERPAAMKTTNNGC